MAAILAGALGAGFLGALTGLGGGVVIVPMLVLGFGVDLRLAVGASLIAVIATSSGAAAAYVREGYTNLRLGMVLEVATVAGALLGAALAPMVDKNAIAVVFSIAVFWSAYMAVRPLPVRKGDDEADAWSARLRLDSAYPVKRRVSGGDTGEPERWETVQEHYRVHHVPWGLALMMGAGVLSALAGIGSGIVKVFAMDRVMRLPFKVSTTTSNFMIGVTAAASAGVYVQRGEVRPEIAGPVAVGALGGALIGARVLPRVKTVWLRWLFATLVTAAGVEMLRRALRGGL